MIQCNSLAGSVHEAFGIPTLASGIAFTVLVAVIVFGGIKRIGTFAGKVVPFMAILYIAAGLVIVFTHLNQVPGLVQFVRQESLSITEGSPRDKLNLGMDYDWEWLGVSLRGNRFGKVLAAGSEPFTDLEIKLAWVADLEIRARPSGSMQGVELAVGLSQKIVACLLPADHLLLEAIPQPDHHSPNGHGCTQTCEKSLLAQLPFFLTVRQKVDQNHARNLRMAKPQAVR